MLAAAPRQASAQVAGENPQVSRAYASVGKACVNESRRLCAGADTTPLKPRAMLICLRPYRASLTLGCRRAISAVPR